MHEANKRLLKLKEKWEDWYLFSAVRVKSKAFKVDDTMPDSKKKAGLAQWQV